MYLIYICCQNEENLNKFKYLILYIYRERNYVSFCKFRLSCQGKFFIILNNFEKFNVVCCTKFLNKLHFSQIKHFFNNTINFITLNFSIYCFDVLSISSMSLKTSNMLLTQRRYGYSRMRYHR